MKKLVTATILAIIAAIFWFIATLDNRVQSEIEKSASHLTGVAVTLDSVDINLMTGNALISGLKVPNPQGYSDNNVFEMGRIAVEVDLSSIFSQPLVINSVLIDDTVVNLELKDNLESNMQDILVVSDQQTGRDQNSSTDSDTGDEKTDSDNGTPGDDSSETKEQSGDADDNAPFRMRVKQFQISETQLKASKGEVNWTDTIDQINITGLDKNEGVTTRVIGIAVVRNLASETLKQAATRSLVEEVKSTVEEVSNSLLESLFKND